MDFGQFDFSKLAKMAQAMGQGQSGGQPSASDKQSLLDRGMKGAQSGMGAADNLAKLPQGMPMGGKGMLDLQTPGMGLSADDQRKIQESMMGIVNSDMGKMAQQYIRNMIQQSPQQPQLTRVDPKTASALDGMRYPGPHMEDRYMGITGTNPNQLNDIQIRDFIQKGIIRSQ